MNGVMGVTFGFRVGDSPFWPEEYDARLTTDGTETIARVRRVLMVDGYGRQPAMATATSRRSPYDIHVPIIGFALALGRALEKLGDGDEETLSVAFRALARACAELGV